jgi:phosphoenolpyruvate carboxykinase (ATP)
MPVAWSDFEAEETTMIDAIDDTITQPLIHVALAKMGLRWIKNPSWNESSANLVERAIADGEVQVTKSNALVAKTGKNTGRSPKGKFIVLNAETARSVWWDNNQAMSPQHFEALKTDLLAHARLKTLFVQDLIAGADALHQLPTRVITEYAWHALFMRHLLKPANDESFVPELTIINLPSFRAEPSRHGTNSETVIAIDLTQKIVLIGGTAYAGEMKKAVFTVMNYLLPAAGVLPMHCSANVGEHGDTAIFFGLSGTGKTTLSADPRRQLIGDDEHGWSDAGIFNIENGCYAKAIGLTEKAEPEIFHAAHQFGSVLENVVMNGASGEPDFTDASLTENTRVAYPLSAILNARPSRLGHHPKTIIMLTADAFGVLPPIAKLNSEQAMQQFLAGYTAKLAGTELGVKSPQATFSACFGAPFLPRHPQVYADMLKELMQKHKVHCFLLNTGWTGGAYGVGSRMKLTDTRKLLDAALSGALDHAPTRSDPVFGFEVPVMVAGVDDKLLNPRESWSDKKAYDAAAINLAQLYEKTWAKFNADVSAPAPLQAAE